ncbi:MAG: DUF3794 domain-containing protein [Clostridia bacterium]|nr:DUF3794 domain-containing protein [Clostridia bacterium]
MAFEPIYEVAACDGLQKLCSGQVVAEAKLVPPHGEEITKVLGVSAIVDASASEVFTGEARIKGKVNFRVLYIGADGENKCIDSLVEFSDKITSDAIVGGKPCVFAKVLDTDIVSATTGEIKLSSVVEVELFGVCPKRSKYLIRGGDSVYARDDKMEYTKVLSEARGMHEVSAEAAIPALGIEAIESRACTKKAIASSGFVVIDGEIVSDIIYRGEGGIGHTSLTTPFSFEVEASGAASGNQAVMAVRIDSALASIISGEETTVTVNYIVEASGFVYEGRTLMPIVDTYSTTNKLNLTRERLSFSCVKSNTYFGDEADGSVTLDAGLPIVDSIITPLGTSVILTGAYANDGKVTLEGLVRTVIVYFSGESNSANSVEAQLPFSISKPIDASEGDSVYATCEALGVNAKIRRGNEIDLRVGLQFGVTVGCVREIEVITDLSEGEQMLAPKSALCVHIGSKRETLWEVAKGLCTTPETIAEQNPELVFPLEGGERVICYRKLERN